jgi:hypothetical protein
MKTAAADPTPAPVTTAAPLGAITAAAQTERQAARTRRPEA